MRLGGVYPDAPVVKFNDKTTYLRKVCRELIRRLRASLAPSARRYAPQPGAAAAHTIKCQRFFVLYSLFFTLYSVFFIFCFLLFIKHKALFYLYHILCSSIKYGHITSSCVSIPLPRNMYHFLCSSIKSGTVRCDN